MSKPVPIDIEVQCGSTWEKTFIVSKNGAVVDLSLYTVTAAVRKSEADTIALVSLSVGSGLSLVPGQGKATLTLTPTQTNALRGMNPVYSLKIVETSTGKTYGAAWGRLLPSREIL